MSEKFISNQQEFKEALGRLGDLYEEGKDCLHKITRPTDPDEARQYDRLFDVLREVRDLSAITMQKLHWKFEN